MKTVVWNMAHKPGNWDLLDEWEELKGADIALLCEATPSPDGGGVIGHGSTKGLEAALGPDKPIDRPWSTAVGSSHPLVPITDARVTRRYYKGSLLPFEPSRPGTWTAALVDVEGVGKVTAVSLYGLMDERSDASVHRSLSELSPIFDHEVYRKRLLLGGDLNILAGRPKGRISIGIKWFWQGSRPTASPTVWRRISSSEHRGAGVSRTALAASAMIALTPGPS
jgi:hypothetical protein